MTELAEVTERLSQPQPPTAFDLGVRRFGYLIMRLTVFLVLFVVLINIYFHRPWLESFLFAVALAVGLTPELLPMIITVTLSRGALRMSKKNVIVKRPSAIQNLGAMTLLCSDKTGTLTEGRIVLERHVNVKGEDSEEVLHLAYLNSFFETGYRSPIDQAILQHKDFDVSQWRKIDEVPFDFERRRVSVLLDNTKERMLVVKGAPEEILALSSSYSEEDTQSFGDMDSSRRNSIMEICHNLEREGFRGIGVAWKRVGPETLHAHVSDETELVFAGIASFHDPAKPDVHSVLKHLAESRVSFRMVTGDSELVSRHLFRTVGLEVTGMLTGAQIQQMDESVLLGKIDEVNLFCRVSPAQKNRIVLAFKKRGYVVGYLGDGANDAPPLHSADVGISVESAVDVAKEAADIILMKSDLKVLLAGVFEGRRTHANIMKYIMMTTSSNFGNMMSMAGAVLVLPFLPMLPLQILLNNFLYDLSEVAIPLDRVDLQSLRQPAQWDMQLVQRFMWVTGLISSLFDFVTFYILLRIFNANEDLFRSGWFVESLATQVLVIFVIRTKYNPFKSRPRGVLVVTSLLVVALVEVVKRWFYHHWAKPRI